MLYGQSKSPELSDKLFHHPTSDYRGAPFWAWNCRLDKETIDEQTKMLQKMGFGGWHVHVRTGLDTPYLSDEYMDMVRRALEDGRQEGMLTYLYDEDRWPSGSCGGRVTKDPKYRARYLEFTPVEEGTDCSQALAVYHVKLHSDGTLEEYECLRENGQSSSSGGTAPANWAAFLKLESPSPWYNGQTYLDTLNPEAVQAFIKTTHERYKEYFQDDFSGAIPSIFTDEPEFSSKQTLSFASDRTPVDIPWTDDLPETYRKTYGTDIFQTLPELFWDLEGGKVSAARYRYHDHVTERFAEAFCDTIGAWCRKNRLYLTGHMMEEPTLYSQTRMVGEAMRCYRGFGIPGIDMLCDFHEYTTAKQCASAVHQQNSPGMLSELYGVTGWNYDFRGHKLQGDWQAALGVTLRVPHLTWMSMKGEAKRDYPACIGYQSPWWDQYSRIEDHFARLNTALTRGKPMVRTAVVHPIESYWLHWGPSEQTAAVRSQLDENFQKITSTLLLNLIDFDFLCESRLPDLCPKASNPLAVGAMSYDVVIVPGCETLRKTTIQRLEDFRKAGGRLIFLGDAPKYVDAVPSEEPAALMAKSEHLSMNEAALVAALEDQRFVDVRRPNGMRTDDLLYQARQDGNSVWLFLAHGKNPVSPDKDPAELLRIFIRGEYTVTLYDTLTGKIAALPASYENGHTVLLRRFYSHDSLLLKLTAGKAGEITLQDQKEASVSAGSEAYYSSPAVPAGNPERFLKPVPVTLAEPNMYLLDLAEYSVDGGTWKNGGNDCGEELLRIGNLALQEVGLPPRQKQVMQPYTLPAEIPSHKLSLRFTIESEIELSHVKIALEDAEVSRIRLNGETAAEKISGWYVDHCIRTVDLPGLKKGTNLLEVEQPLGTRTNTEWMYLLGDFGVRVCGSCKKITAPVRELCFADIVPQGLPFYTGNLTYHLKAVFGRGAVLRVPCYRGALIRVFVDGKEAGPIIYSPYTLALPDVPKTEHQIDILLYNTRQNGFGQLHHTQCGYYYQDPNSWRTEGDDWSYEYQFFPDGILRTPELYRPD